MEVDKSNRAFAQNSRNLHHDSTTQTTGQHASWRAESQDTLLAGDEVGGECPRIVVDGVGDVVSEVLEWALARDDSLDKEAKH